MFLIVGLGNIGREYESTRHNLGFLLLDQIIEDYGFIAQGKKFKGEYFTGQIAEQKIIALKPYTFMNLSGESILEAARFFKIPNENILVLHDDVDLEPCKIKVKIGGGHGGHNGLRSIDGIIGKNYARLRFGVGRPENRSYDTADYVLGKFSKSELTEVEITNAKISDHIEHLVEKNIEKFLAEISSS